MTQQNDDLLDLRTELGRIQLAAQYAQKPDEIREAIEALALSVMAILDSFGLQTITIRPALVQSDGRQKAYIFEQRSHKGKIVRTETIATTKLEVV